MVEDIEPLAATSDPLRTGVKVILERLSLVRPFEMGLVNDHDEIWSDPPNVKVQSWYSCLMRLSISLTFSLLVAIP